MNMAIIKFSILCVAIFSACHIAGAAEKDAKKPFGDHVTLRGNLGESRRRFAESRKGTVAFMGGSITEMNGYRPMVCELLKKRYPATAFTFIDAGISSTTSTTGAFRLEQDVLSKGPIDLFFVEFAVNDDQDGHNTRQECIRAMEGIVRHARHANPKMDIVFTYFVNEPMLATLQAGKVPLTIEAHDAVAALYGIPSINLAAEVAEQISAGQLTWKKFGGVHPAPFGNAICASMIDELFQRMDQLPALAVEPGSAGIDAPKPLDTNSYENGRFIELGDATLGAGWSIGIPDWNAISGGKRERFTKVPLLCAIQPGSELKLEFTGKAVGAFVVAGPDAGTVEAKIDEREWKKVDLLHSYSKTLHFPRTVMFDTELPDGKHQLMLRILDSNNSSGTAARIMHFVAN